MPNGPRWIQLLLHCQGRVRVRHTCGASLEGHNFSLYATCLEATLHQKRLILCVGIYLILVWVVSVLSCLPCICLSVQALVRHPSYVMSHLCLINPLPSWCIIFLSTQSQKLFLITSKLDVDDWFLTYTGISKDINNWLLLAEQAANVTREDCVVCLGLRPILKVIPSIYI